MPLTISSLLNMTGAGSPFWLLVSSTCVYALGGAVDSLLFVVVRRSFIRSANASVSSSGRSRSWSRPGHSSGMVREDYPLEGITVSKQHFTFIDIPSPDGLAKTRVADALAHAPILDFVKGTSDDVLHQHDNLSRLVQISLQATNKLVVHHRIIYQ
jgi:hypothetical protein